MSLKVFTFVCLFIIRLRFPPNKSVADIVRARYGNATLKTVRKFEKLDFKKRKLLLDINFLETCRDANVTPRFLQFRTANYNLKKSSTYTDCQKLLLEEEIRTKQKKLDEHHKNFEEMKKDLHSTLSYFDFLHITSLFFEPNIKAMEKIELKQNVKLIKIFEENVRHDPKQIIHNYSSHTLTPEQESLLIKGLNFALPPKKLKYEDYMLPFELLYRDFHTLEKKENELVFAKNELRHIAYSSFKAYNKKEHKFENISKLEHKAFLELLELKDLIIQKADKGNVIVVIDKCTYFTKMSTILNDETKFIKVNFEKRNEELDYLLNKQSQILDFLKELRDNKVITDQVFNELRPSGCQPGVLYGLCKVHKGVTPDGKSPPFRPILSAINTPSYKIAKFLVPMLSELTKNKYVSKDSFEFAKNVRNQNPELFMASFDIDSLFTNVPLDETIDISVKKLFGRKKKYNGFSRENFKKLLSFAVKNSFFLFNGTYYEQVDGVAMGSPLGPTLANIFLCYWEEIWIQKCPKQFRPIYYNRFMDDTFLLFSSQDHVLKFHKYINSRHGNMTFTYEIEKNNSLAFLDVLVTREDTFCTSLYRKPTFSGLYSNFDSFMPESYKKGLIYTLLHRAFVLCCSWKTFHMEVSFLKDIFRKNLFPAYFTDRCVKIFLDKIFTVKKVVLIAPKKELRICLPFLGKQSFEIKTKLCKFIDKNFPQCKLQVIFNSNTRLRNFFNFKDKIPLRVRSHILYRYTCDGCNAIYLGKTRRHYGVRIFEHLGISLTTGNKFSYNSQNINNSAILNHINCTSCTGKSENFKIIGSAKTDFLLSIKETLLIHKNKPKLNTSERSVPTYLFE